MDRAAMDHNLTETSSAAVFETARVANLLHFAQLSPDARVQWLTEMLDLAHSLRHQGDTNRTRKRGADQGSAAP